MSARLARNESHATASRYVGLVSVDFQGRLELAPREVVQFSEEQKALLGEQYTVQQGDRIDVLAFEMLGDSRLWWLLADLNSELVSDPQVLVPGTLIFIPNLEVAAQYT